ncbi:MAG TPA: ChbG/HpnK family deacetylase [Pirellulales bacterium]|nr:ChbG/HpnK family deacetylase [Pirellulales bacterium]
MTAQGGPSSKDGARRVALHADDLGMNRAVNKGIFQAFEQGLLTSASVLTNAPHAISAIACWKDRFAGRPAGEFAVAAGRRLLDDLSLPFDLGIHLNLSQGRPLTADRYPSGLLDRDGCFPGIGSLFRRLYRATRWEAAIEAELSAQIKVLLDHGLRPTHLNGHQYVELLPALARCIPRLLRRYAIPALRVAWEPPSWRTSLRTGFRPANCLLSAVKRHFARKFRARIGRCDIPHPDVYFGASHAGRIDLALLRGFLSGAGSFSLAEIALHPASAAPHPASAAVTPDAQAVEPEWRDPLAAWRPRELELLLSPALADFLLSQGLRLGRIGSPAG